MNKDKLYRIRQVKRIVCGDTGAWCQLPYRNHPKGCPNYGKRNTCPPDAPHISEVLDLEKPIYIAFSDFDLFSHMKRMSQKHPKWSVYQCRNVLYWQGTSKAEMRRRARIAKTIMGADTIIECAEGMGVNVYATCRHVGLKLEKIKNLKMCHHVALVGWGKR